MLKQFIKEVSKIWTLERPNQLAAALAYYSMFSFAPIIFVSISIVSFFIEEIDPSVSFTSAWRKYSEQGSANWCKISSCGFNYSFEQLLVDLIGQFPCACLRCLRIILSAPIFLK